MKSMRQEVMIGNFGIARGLVEAGLEIAAAYPGTPSSEIIPGIIEFNRRENGNIHAEWSTNERCAFEVAFGAASMGKRAACMMKQVGLNVAFPSILNGRLKKIKGALVIVSCDDPGPQSSQTEQDTRLIATLFGLPVFDPSSPREACDMAYYAMHYSSEHKVPVILRSTHRVSHAREAVPVYRPGKRKVLLNEGIMVNSVERGTKSEEDSTPNAERYPLKAELGIVASGMSYSIVMDVVESLSVEHLVPVYKVLRIFPADERLADFVRAHKNILVFEETDSVLEMQIDSGDKVLGRRNGFVPSAGELTYDVVRNIVKTVLKKFEVNSKQFVEDHSIEESLKEIKFADRPPRLCAGCPHRATFYAMKYAFPNAVFPGDIGCYTLGISMGAVDTCIDMGGGVNLASGFYNTFNQDDALMPIIASIGDSTFFHACLEPLYDAAEKKKKFILVIMDNSTTAMTGMQPTPQSGISASGATVGSIKIEGVVAGFGIKFLKIVDPYDVPLTLKTIKEAQTYLKEADAGPAVIIARRDCLLHVRGQGDESFRTEDIEENCNGCRQCLKVFDCPAIVFDETAKKVKVDKGLCVRCGICLYACPTQDKRKELKHLHQGRG